MGAVRFTICFFMIIFILAGFIRVENTKYAWSNEKWEAHEQEIYDEYPFITDVKFYGDSPNESIVYSYEGTGHNRDFEEIFLLTKHLFSNDDISEAYLSRHDKYHGGTILDWYIGFESIDNTQGVKYKSEKTTDGDVNSMEEDFVSWVIITPWSDKELEELELESSVKIVPYVEETPQD